MCACGALTSRRGLRCRPCGAVVSWATRHARAEQTFWSRVDQSGGADACWPWLRGLTGGGYGHTWYEGRQIAAHRAAMQYTLGRQLTPDEMACHRCDNRPCCNPAHLFVGTAFDNNLDMTVKGRRRSRPPGFRHLTQEERLAVVEARRSGETAESVARRFGVHRETVRLTVRRLDRKPDGTFVPRRRFGARDLTDWSPAA